MSDIIRLSVLSQEVVRVPYGQVDTAGVGSDPTGTTPEFSIVAEDVAPTVWANGSWETSSTNQTIGLGFQQLQSPYKARYTIDGTALTVGSYHLWFRLSNYVKKIGRVEIV